MRQNVLVLDHHNIAIDIIQYGIGFIFSTTVKSYEIIIPFTARLEFIFNSVDRILLQNGPNQ